MKTYVLIVLILALIRMSARLKEVEEVNDKAAYVILVLLIGVAIIVMSYMPE